MPEEKKNIDVSEDRDKTIHPDATSMHLIKMSDCPKKIMLLGYESSGKSAVGNGLCGSNCFKKRSKGSILLAEDAFDYIKSVKYRSVLYEVHDIM